MTPETGEVPLTANSVRAINALARHAPASPVVVPISYEKVTVPSALGECIQGVIRDPHAFMLDDRNAPLEESRLFADDDGQIYDGIFRGITLKSLLEGIPRETLTLWALHLNLADPLMPSKLKEFHRKTPGMGLIAIVIPSLATAYIRAFEDMNPSLVYPRDYPVAADRAGLKFHKRITI